MSEESVREAIDRFFAKSTNPVIFTGAGISARAGLPQWKKLLIGLAESIRSKDPLTTQQMLTAINEGDFLHAAEYFQISKKVLEGDKNATLKLLLGEYDFSRIKDVASLPFNACITTNFDRSILDAIASAKGLAASDYKLGDASFKEAQWDERVFVARIHGAVENPKSMVLSQRQFDSVLTNDDYIDLLRTIFIQRNVLFLGFSFYDPAIRAILNGIDSKIGSSHPGRHMVILGENAESEFLLKAARLNIEIVKYKTDNCHEELWGALSTASHIKFSNKKIGNPSSATKKYMATCLARARTSDHAPALRYSIAEGIISALIQESAPVAISVRELAEKFRLTLGLREKESKEIIKKTTKALVDANLCSRQKNSGTEKLLWKGDMLSDNSFSEAIDYLSKSIKDRAKVQEAWDMSDAVVNETGSFYKHLIEQRGWDLGAAFALGLPPEAVEVESALNAYDPQISTYDRERLGRILADAIRNPTPREAQILGELGRISFGIEIAFKSPKSVFVQQAILPRTIYFDTSVLLPAIVPGHPIQETYSASINRLREAASASAITLGLSVCDVYLNEIISHKRRAEEFYRECGDDFDRIAVSETLLHGAANSNVYVGAYANRMQQGFNLGFEKFLQKEAPYSSESELGRWLKGGGFNIVAAQKVGKYAKIYAALERGSGSYLASGKTAILIEHDSIQLARLDSDYEKDSRTIFVTADRQLRNYAVESGVRGASDNIMSNVGLVQFIEMMLGGLSDRSGLSEILWSPQVSDAAHAVRAYFTTRALEHFDVATAMAMPGIVEEYVDLTLRELKRNDLSIDSENTSKRAKALRLVGQFEDRYFEGMSREIKKMEAKFG